MADIEYTHNGLAQDMDNALSRAGISKLINIAGALASVALVGGVGLWGYQLLMRDVSGVPVVRALEGPMRVQPENPGGEQADHQGLSVNAVAARGTAEAPADTVKLAPRPIGLSAEDKTNAELAADQQADEEEIEQAAATSAEDPAIDNLVAQLVAGAKPLDSVTSDGTERLTQVAAEIVQPEPLAPLSAEDMIAPEPAVLSGPGLPRSLRPVLRPAQSDVARAAAVEQAVLASVQSIATREVDADTLPVGTRLAQLGAFESPEVARSEWERLNVKFADYLQGKSRVIQKASSGGRTFYRLRAMGFEDINDARRFCSVLVAENADCIPVTTR